MRKKSMQVSVEALMEAAGATETFWKAVEMRNEFALTVENEPYMRLHVEVTAAGEVAVSHTYEQAGDLMFDPEIVFDPDHWNAVEITQSPMNVWQRAPKGSYLPGANSLANVWARNIRAQGFTDPSRAIYTWGQEEVQAVLDNVMPEVEQEEEKEIGYWICTLL